LLLRKIQGSISKMTLEKKKLTKLSDEGQYCQRIKIDETAIFIIISYISIGTFIAKNLVKTNLRRSN
jgi:hypothetical protein